MIITSFITNVYQLAVTRAVMSLLQPRNTTIVYCSEFINQNNKFLSYIGALDGVGLLSVSEDSHKTKIGLFAAGRAVILNSKVQKKVLESDLVLFGDPYLLSQRHYVDISKFKALIEDSPTLFSYFRYRDQMPTIRRWLAERFGNHPQFDLETPCYGLSSINNCLWPRHINLLKKLNQETMDIIKSEIQKTFKSEFEALYQISPINQEGRILLLSQPLASDGIVGSVDQQIEFYMANIDKLHSAGFRVFFKLHPRDIANRVQYPIESEQLFNFSPPMELFEDELSEYFVGIASYSSTAFAESTKFARINLSL